MYPKLHHAGTPNAQAIADLDAGWAQAWRKLGFAVVGWGWLQGDPTQEAELAVELSRRYDLDGYIANAEDAYEGAGKWRSAPFVSKFRALAPHAPLALSYIGLGVPYRDLDWKPWLDAGAVFMPQLYWGDSAISLNGPLASADQVPIPRLRIKPTLGTSGFAHPYPAAQYAQELLLTTGFNVWLLDSTSDDYLRALAPAIPHS